MEKGAGHGEFLKRTDVLIDVLVYDSCLGNWTAVNVEVKRTTLKGRLTDEKGDGQPNGEDHIEVEHIQTEKRLISQGY